VGATGTVAGMLDVCVVGSANLDLVASTPRRPAAGETVHGTAFAEHPGGKGLNQAVAAARAGATVAFVGAVGRDAAGDTLRAVLAAEHIDTSGLARGDRPSGRAVIVVDAEGENSIVVVAGANAEVVVDALPAARVLLVQLEIPLAVVTSAVVRAKATGATTVVNAAPAAALAPDLLAAVDVVVANDAEAERLGGVDALLGAGVTTAIVTRGAAGVVVAQPGARWHQPAFRVRAVDTTGAGDAFCGVLAAGLAAGRDLHAAVRAAAAAGALAAAAPGAVPSLPGAGAIAALLADPEQGAAAAAR
jgi:ribokinase